MDIKSIGFCSHYSQQGDWAFDFALELARKNGLQLNVFHWLDSPFRFRRDFVYEDDKKEKLVRVTDELKSKKWKFAGSDIGSWFVVGSLAVTAAATGVPVWGIAAIVADQLLDAPKLKDIPESIKGLADESKELNNSPVGILFKYGNK